MPHLTNVTVGLDRSGRRSRRTLLAHSRPGLARVFSRRARLAGVAAPDTVPGRAGGAREALRAPGGAVVAPWAHHALTGLLEGGVRPGLAIVAVAGRGVLLPVGADFTRDAHRGPGAGVEAGGAGRALQRPLEAVRAWDVRWWCFRGCFSR